MTITHTETSVLSHDLHCIASLRLPSVDVSLLQGSRPRRLAAISHQHHILLTAVLKTVSSWHLVLGTDDTENTAYNHPSKVAWASLAAIT
jgi:hypothetical protein